MHARIAAVARPLLWMSTSTTIHAAAAAAAQARAIGQAISKLQKREQLHLLHELLHRFIVALTD